MCDKKICHWVHPREPYSILVSAFPSLCHWKSEYCKSLGKNRQTRNGIAICDLVCKKSSLFTPTYEPTMFRKHLNSVSEPYYITRTQKIYEKEIRKNI